MYSDFFAKLTGVKDENKNKLLALTTDYINAKDAAIIETIEKAKDKLDSAILKTIQSFGFFESRENPTIEILNRLREDLKLDRQNIPMSTEMQVKR